MRGVGCVVRDETEGAAGSGVWGLGSVKSRLANGFEFVDGSVRR